MNRFPKTSATAGGVVTDYVGASPQVDRAQKVRPQRKRRYPGFRIRMSHHYVEEIRAVVECTGVGMSQFVYNALWVALHKTAAKIGMAPCDIVRLSKRTRAEIRRKYRLAMIVNQVLKPERN